MSECDNRFCSIITTGGGICTQDEMSSCKARANYLEEMKLKAACLKSIGDLSHVLGYAKSHCDITKKNTEMLDRAIDRVMGDVGIKDFKE